VIIDLSDLIDGDNDYIVYKKEIQNKIISLLNKKITKKELDKVSKKYNYLFMEICICGISEWINYYTDLKNRIKSILRDNYVYKCDIDNWESEVYDKYHMCITNNKRDMIKNNITGFLYLKWLYDKLLRI
jgi:hypothetical protein